MRGTKSSAFQINKYGRFAKDTLGSWTKPKPDVVQTHRDLNLGEMCVKLFKRHKDNLHLMQL